MSIYQKITFVLATAVIVFIFGQTAQAQADETYTGTIISYNGPRLRTASFTLRITGRTTDEQARQYLSILQENGQKKTLDTITKNDLGSLSVDSRIGPRVNVVRESVVDGKRRIFVVFDRWEQFAELRGGYRSLDYPFSVLELFIDERTGKGEGTFIAAARIRFDKDDNQVEIENFGTYPAKLTAVKLRGQKQ